MAEETPKKDTRMVKCPKCGDKLPKCDAIQHTNKRYYHKECYEEVTRTGDSYKELVTYICELYGWSRPSGMILKQIKEFSNDYGFTHKGMELTLRYFFEILDNPMDKEKGIGIIPYVYEDAKKYMVQKINVNKSLKEFGGEGLILPSRVIEVESVELKKEKKYVPLDDLY